MKTKVSVRKCESYDGRTVSAAVKACVDDLGGLASMIKPGDKVLLKPNLLKSAGPSEAVVTHPQVVEAVAAMVIDLGAKPSIGDSPPLGNIARVLSRSGYDPFMTKLGIKPIPFKEKVTLEFSENRLFKRIDLAKEVFEFDSVINLPKLKTHAQMGMTLGVKNLFGTVIGTDKASWHMRAGKDLDSFATVLVQIYEKIAPTVTILDAVLGMEGYGPTSGDPRLLGFISSSRDAVALDAVVCSLVGLGAENLRTCVIGADQGVGIADPAQIEVLGDKLKNFPLKDFQHPKSVNIRWNLSRWNPVRRFMENHMITKPDIDLDACKSCGVCLEHCPPKAIRQTKNAMVIDRDKCISCFCCHELCSNQAVRIVQPFWGRFLNKISQ
jgi:uncharacterized protein (DUF362 family)/Pyruvate/2-oxoacid:ferredoxin oxidoreductase delta subunit